MITELPKKRSEVESYNPKLLVLIGRPKAGKSSLMAALEDNLVLDLEDGYRALSVMKVQVRNSQDFFQVRALLDKEMKETGKKPYRFITIDNATRLETYSLGLAARLYQNTSMGQGWGYLKNPDGTYMLNDKKQKITDPKADVRLLPNGGGYLYLREAIKQILGLFTPYCETLILVTHVKDKQIRRDGKELTEVSPDLAGKSGDIICGEADAVGVVYREGNKTFISFEGGDDTVREARCLHLRGKKFCVAESDPDNNLKVDMSKIFLPVEANKQQLTL